MCTTREQQKHISTHTKLSISRRCQWSKPHAQACSTTVVWTVSLHTTGRWLFDIAHFGKQPPHTASKTQPAQKVGTLTESLQYSYSPAAGSGRCMWVPHGECATCGSVRGNANTSSAHRGGCKRGPRATRVLRSSKKQYNWELFFAASNIEVPLFRAAKASSYFFLLTNQRLWPPRPPQNLFSAGPQFR